MNITQSIFIVLIIIEALSILYMAMQTYVHRKEYTFYPIGTLMLLGTLITTIVLYSMGVYETV